MPTETIYVGYLTTNEYQVNALPFPDFGEEKTKDYAKRWGQAIYSAWIRNVGGWNYENYSEADNLRAYGQGQQSVEKYKPYLTQFSDDETGDRELHANISYSIVSFWPVLRRAAINHLMDLDFEAICSSLNPQAASERERKIFEKSVMRKLQPLKQMRGMEPSGEYVPQSEEELEMWESLGGAKLVEEWAFELLCKKSFLDNDWEDDVKEQFLEDQWDLGIAVTKNYICWKTFTTKIRAVDPKDCIIPWSKRKNYKDLPYFGEIDYLTLQELYDEAGDELTPTQREALEMKYKNGAGVGNTRQHRFQNNQPNSGLNELESGRGALIPILRYQWNDYSFSKHKVERTNRKGEKIVQVQEYDPKRKSGPKRTYTKGWYPTVYEAVWVIEDEICFGFKPMNDITFDDERPQLSYTVHKTSNVSMTSAAIGPIDDMQLATLRLRMARATSKPDGYGFNVDALQALSMNSSGHAEHWTKWIGIARQTGDIPYRGSAHYGSKNASIGPPIMALPGGMGQYAVEQWDTFTKAAFTLQRISGVTEYMLAASFNPDAPVGHQEGQTDATANIMKTFSKSLRTVQGIIAGKLISHWKELIIYSPNEIKVNLGALGGMATKVLTLTKDMALKDIGCYMQARPTNEQKLRLVQSAHESARMRKEGGIGITMGDVFMIERFVFGEGNLKHAQFLLAHRENLEAQRQMQMNQMNQEQSQQVGLQIKDREAQIKELLEKEKTNRTQMEKELDTKGTLQEIDRQGQWKTKHIMQQGAVDRRTKKVENNGDTRS